MAMQLSNLEILEQADFPQGQARAIVRVLEGEAAARREDLATKADLAELPRKRPRVLENLHIRVWIAAIECRLSSAE